MSAQPLRQMPESRVEPESKPTGTTSKPNRTNVFEGSVWMVAITLVLFFLPAVNGFVGGLVGGYKVGSAGRAIISALIPAAISAVGLWLLLSIFDLPVVGLAAGAALGAIIIFSEISLFVGAAIGGAIGREKYAG